MEVKHALPVRMDIIRTGLRAPGLLSPTGDFFFHPAVWLHLGFIPPVVVYGSLFVRLTGSLHFRLLWRSL